MERASLLEVNQLSVKYQTGESVLKSVSFSVEPNEITCVIGESGCGKTTLLNTILRMSKKIEITAGEVLYHDLNLEHMTRNETRPIRGAGIGMIFQEPTASLDPTRKIKTLFYETLRAHQKISRKAAYRKAYDILSNMGFNDVDEVLRSYPVQLSGGMNQRVAIGLAMSLEPDLLLADEPTSALDVITQSQLIDELLKLRKTYGTSLLLVTHNMGVVRRMADKIAVMYGGRIVEYGRCEKVLGNPRHPYTRALLEAIPRLDGIPPKTIPGNRIESIDHEGCAFSARCTKATTACNEKMGQKKVIDQDHWTLCDVFSQEESH